MRVQAVQGGSYGVKGVVLSGHKRRSVVVESNSVVGLGYSLTHSFTLLVTHLITHSGVGSEAYEGEGEDEDEHGLHSLTPLPHSLTL